MYITGLKLHFGVSENHGKPPKPTSLSLSLSLSIAIKCPYPSCAEGNPIVCYHFPNEHGQEATHMSQRLLVVPQKSIVFTKVHHPLF